MVPTGGSKTLVAAVADSYVRWGAVPGDELKNHKRLPLRGGGGTACGRFASLTLASCRIEFYEACVFRTGVKLR